MAVVYAPPSKVRAEFMVGDEMLTAVIIGDTWWSWSSTGEVTTNEGDRGHSHGWGPGAGLIDPSSILPAVELAVVGRTIFLTRPGVEVLATPSEIDEYDEESSDWRFAAHDLGMGAEDYRVIVDAERGVLLRSEALIGGEPFHIIEMGSVEFDGGLGDEVFAPPRDRGIESLGFHGTWD